MKFSIFNFQFSKNKDGTSLLLVVVLLSAMLSISLGVFNLVFGQIRLSGEIADSFVSFFSADQGVEKILYRDRVLKNICTAPGTNCFVEGPINVSSGGCYSIRVSKNGGNTELVTVGQYRCGANSPRVVKRGFQVNY
jgi:hypothetical protein